LIPVLLQFIYEFGEAQSGKGSEAQSGKGETPTPGQPAEELPDDTPKAPPIPLPPPPEKPHVTLIKCSQCACPISPHGTNILPCGVCHIGYICISCNEKQTHPSHMAEKKPVCQNCETKYVDREKGQSGTCSICEKPKVKTICANNPMCWKYCCGTCTKNRIAEEKAAGRRSTNVKAYCADCWKVELATRIRNEKRDEAKNTSTTSTTIASSSTSSTISASTSSTSSTTSTTTSPALTTSSSVIPFPLTQDNANNALALAFNLTDFLNSCVDGSKLLRKQTQHAPVLQSSIAPYEIYQVSQQGIVSSAVNIPFNCIKAPTRYRGLSTTFITQLKQEILSTGWTAGSLLSLNYDTHLNELHVVDGLHRFTAISELVHEGKWRQDAALPAKLYRDLPENLKIFVAANANYSNTHFNAMSWVDMTIAILRAAMAVQASQQKKKWFKCTNTEIEIAIANVCNTGGSSSTEGNPKVNSASNYWSHQFIQKKWGVLQYIGTEYDILMQVSNPIAHEHPETQCTGLQFLLLLNDFTPQMWQLVRESCGIFRKGTSKGLNFPVGIGFTFANVYPRFLTYGKIKATTKEEIKKAENERVLGQSSWGTFDHNAEVLFKIRSLAMIYLEKCKYDISADNLKTEIENFWKQEKVSLLYYSLYRIAEPEAKMHECIFWQAYNQLKQGKKALQITEGEEQKKNFTSNLDETLVVKIPDLYWVPAHACQMSIVIADQPDRKQGQQPLRYRERRAVIKRKLIFLVRNMRTAKYSPPICLNLQANG
jgi:hypothetical protein